MAEYNKVIRQFKRMCRYYNGEKDKCPLYCKGHGCNISHCRMLAFEDEKFANVVKTWAAAHEEPIYPTWGEYLLDKGIVEAHRPIEGGVNYTPTVKMKCHISADIAEKLGLKPKER